VLRAAVVEPGSRPDRAVQESELKNEAESPPRIIDTHAHLDFPEFSQDLDSVLSRAEEMGVAEVITIGIDLASSGRAVELAQQYPQIHATVGIHPHGARLLEEETLGALRALATGKGVVAVGEIGLDYYRDRQPRDVQRLCLRQQVELACRVKLPAVFHIRDAYDDFMGIIPDYVASLPGVVLHCFSGDWEVARRCLDLGFYLSIPGTVTFPKAEVLQEVVKRAPLDRLLLETDCPYLAPVPYRGKVNEPSFVYHTARKVAELRGCTLSEVASRTTSNAHEVFRLGGAKGGECVDR
jgi:TatD DNase family protein